MKEYQVTVNHMLMQEKHEFATELEAREYGSKMRKQFATELGVHWMDVWFDIEEAEPSEI